VQQGKVLFALGLLTELVAARCLVLRYNLRNQTTLYPILTNLKSA
jgi:hypothetical protein